MSQAASARYDNICPTCLAKPRQPCRTLTGTRRVTDTHLSRLSAPRVESSRVGEWGGD